MMYQPVLSAFLFGSFFLTTLKYSPGKAHLRLRELTVSANLKKNKGHHLAHDHTS
jgi:TorA maturation chaperone TorD